MRASSMVVKHGATNRKSWSPPPGVRVAALPTVMVVSLVAAGEEHSPGAGTGNAGALHPTAQPGLQVLVTERRVDCGGRDVPQLGLAEAEPLGANLVLAGDSGAEVGRVVGAERDLDPGGAQLRERMLLV